MVSQKKKAMQDALQRIQNAVKDGVIDKATLGQKTTDARNKFFSTDPFFRIWCILILGWYMG